MERLSCQTSILTHAIPWSLLRFVQKIQKVISVKLSYSYELLKKYTYNKCEDEVNLKKYLTKYSSVYVCGLAEIRMINRKGDFSKNIDLIA